MQRGQIVSGRVILVSNRRQSYNVQIDLQLDDIPGSTVSNNLDLKNPYFRYTGQPIQAPPGCNTTSPSEDYWQQLDSTVQQQQSIQIGQSIMMNGGGITNGIVGNATMNGNSIVLNGTALTNGIPVAALNTGAQSLQAPVNLTAQFDSTQQHQAQVVNPQFHSQQQPNLTSSLQQSQNTLTTNHVHHHQSNNNSRQLNTGSPLGIVNPYGSPLNTLGNSSPLGAGSVSGGISGMATNSSLFNNQGISSHLGNSTNVGSNTMVNNNHNSNNNNTGSMVTGINNMNFPVNQSLMIGDYAAAIGGASSLSPFKPL